MLKFNNDPCWRGRSTTLNICLSLVTLFASSALAQIGSGMKNVCPTAYFNSLSETVLKKMGNETEPCNDFYEFACGTFNRKADIPRGMGTFSTTYATFGTYEKRLYTIVTQERVRSQILQLPNNLYKACTNTTLIESLDAQPAKQISDLIGGWPVVLGDKWNLNNTWTWQGLAKNLIDRGSPTYIFTISVIPHPENATRHIINLDRPQFEVPRDAYYRDCEKYYDYMVKIATLFGAEHIRALVELLHSRRLEKNLYELSQIDEQTTNTTNTYNLMSIKQLQESYPYVEWLNFINDLLRGHHKVDENEVINLSVPKFFSKLGDLLQSFNKRQIANYMMWRFHESMLPFMSERFSEQRSPFKLNLGNPVQQSREEKCFKVVKENLPIALAALFVNSYVTINQKQTAMKMFENIREVFKQTLDDCKWMDNETKEEAKAKADSLRILVGFPDEIWDNAKVEEYYGELKIDPNAYLSSILDIKSSIADYNFRALRLPVQDIDWVRDFKLNRHLGAYTPSQNNISISASVFHSILFSKVHPMYLNYGFLGATIAHELTHSFFGLGCMFDADCKWRHWWRPSSQETATKRAECFIEQYNNFTDGMTGLSVNGNLTLDENVADNSGIKHAYLAYNRWLDTNHEERRLPGLKYTPHQTFWISYAQLMCAKYTEDGMRQQITTDIHAPENFRVLGVLRNNKDFARDFNCPENSPMNPVKKCEML